MEISPTVEKGIDLFGRFLSNGDNQTVVVGILGLLFAGWGLRKGYRAVKTVPGLFRSAIAGLPSIVVQRLAGMVPFVGGPALLGDAVYNWKSGLSALPLVNPGVAVGLGVSLTFLSLLLVFGDITESPKSTSTGAK